jgi:hypothetical protein
MLMVKSDKKSKVFRDQVALLKEYSRLHDLPEVIYQTVKAVFCCPQLSATM